VTEPSSVVRHAETAEASQQVEGKLIAKIDYEPIAAPGPGRVRTFVDMSRHRLGLLGLWAILFVIFGIIEPNVFLQTGTFNTIFGSQQPLVFLGLALVCTFGVGEFDLSVAATLGLAGTIVTVLSVIFGVPLWEAVLAAMVASVMVGAVNATLIVLIGIDAIVVTLGMSTFLLGLTLWMSNSAAVSGLSDSFGKIANTQVGGLPITFYYGVLLALGIAYVQIFTPLGRDMSFVAENRDVALLSGVRVKRIRFGSYVTSSLIVGVGGVLLAANVGGFDPQSSVNYLLPAFSAVFLGTVVISPGSFNPIGTMVAIYFLVTGIVGLQLAGVTGWISQVFYGGSLIVAVTVSHLTRRRAL
jgi:ribose transport system permease protein